MRTKHTHFAYSIGSELASKAVKYIESPYDALSVFLIRIEEKLIDCLFTPQKYSALHLYLDHILTEQFENSYDDWIDSTTGKMLSRSFFKLYEAADMLPAIDKPRFEDSYSCKCGNKCENCMLVHTLLKYFINNFHLVKPVITHSAYHILIYNKLFLAHFHTLLAKVVNDPIIKVKYATHYDAAGYISRVKLNSWIKKAIYFRDKGCCVICKRDVSGLLNLTATLHIDHIVPLASYGNNDSSNFQLLCEKCNLKKGARKSTTSAFDIPLWNLDKSWASPIVSDMEPPLSDS